MIEAEPFRIKAQILCGGEPVFGPGKAMVLESIRQFGSISAAGRHLQMRYRRTWNLVDMINRCWNEPLVVAARGGGKNAGARLTARGETVLAAYRALEARLAHAAYDGRSGCAPARCLIAVLHLFHSPRMPYLGS